MLLVLKILSAYNCSEMTYEKLLHRYLNEDINFILGVLSSNYYSKAVSCSYNLPFSTQDGYTALRTASFNGHHKVVELLLGAGANPDLQDKVRIQQDSCVHSNLSNVNGTSSCEPRSPYTTSYLYACMCTVEPHYNDHLGTKSSWLLY